MSDPHQLAQVLVDQAEEAGALEALVTELHRRQRVTRRRFSLPPILRRDGRRTFALECDGLERMDAQVTWADGRIVVDVAYEGEMLPRRIGTPTLPAEPPDEG